MARRYAGLIFAALALLAAAPAIAGPDDSQRWVFRVFLDDREIGFHEFKVNRTESTEKVEINARFDVKVLFFNAYSYEHLNQENWSAGCLQGIESRTNDNGTLMSVSGESRLDGFFVTTHEQSGSTGSDCLSSFAYWNRDILSAKQLLNSQTGALSDISVEEQGRDNRRFGASEIAAVKYTLQTGDGPISLWYTADGGDWLSLEAPAKGGRTIRYEPVILPFLPVEEAQLAMD
jgi:hypothetical protein